jgi:hypothetical protein
MSELHGAAYALGRLIAFGDPVWRTVATTLMRLGDVVGLKPCASVVESDINWAITHARAAA